LPAFAQTNASRRSSTLSAVISVLVLGQLPTVSDQQHAEDEVIEQLLM
jgi:hypothetical protein